MTTDPPLDFNAWRDPWVPVLIDTRDQLIPLRDLFLRAPEIQSLGSTLTPLDRDSLLRLLICLTAVIGREIREEDVVDSFPDYAIQSFESAHAKRFNVTGTKPFLQRWDHPQSELDTLVTRAKGKPVKGLLPIEQLHPHEPGGSSSQWAVRLDSRDAEDPAVATLLLVTAWFQTKNGNGQDPWGGKASKGSAGTWHTNPFALWYSDPTSLARTLWANTPRVWLVETDLPLFLDHVTESGLPEDFADSPKSSVLRFSYTKTLPLLRPSDRGFTDFVLGPDDSIPDPGAGLGRDLKERLGRVHEHDHSRLYTEKRNKAGVVTDLLPRGAFGTRMSSTEGFVQWFRAERAIDTAMRAWHDLERASVPDRSELHGWMIDLFSETTDGKGSREWASWDTLPALLVDADADTRTGLQALLQFASQCRWAFLPAGRTATGESKDAPAIVSGQAAFYTDLRPVLLTLASEVGGGELPNLEDYARQVQRIAEKAFDRSTEPLMTPRSIAAVAQGRAQYRALVRGALRKSPMSTPIPQSEEVS